MILPPAFLWPWGEFHLFLPSLYRVSHLLVHLSWVDFDLGVPQSCPLAQPLLQNSHQPRRNLTDSEHPKPESTQPNPVYEKMGHPV